VASVPSGTLPAGKFTDLLGRGVVHTTARSFPALPGMRPRSFPALPGMREVETNTARSFPALPGMRESPKEGIDVLSVNTWLFFGGGEEECSKAEARSGGRPRALID
jgi:hypothetical protein